jgi:hypothetical protein
VWEVPFEVHIFMHYLIRIWVENRDGFRVFLKNVDFIWESLVLQSAKISEANVARRICVNELGLHGLPSILARHHHLALSGCHSVIIGSAIFCDLLNAITVGYVLKHLFIHHFLLAAGAHEPEQFDHLPDTFVKFRWSFAVTALVAPPGSNFILHAKATVKDGAVPVGALLPLKNYGVAQLADEVMVHWDQRRRHVIAGVDHQNLRLHFPIN